eukprot:TRINITY_DN23734_c0_g1_i2.p2 TRINITY_DN23734_c0_g1~~TRINITY_DN23734_c0_g1_i2.p2  ORF type:complete len:123 (+),score=49.79 TRINITY_DN23734_c0_g1_i2:230-598(+)
MQVTRICGFLLLGYREQRWHWEESIVMMCKLGIVFIAVFIKDAVLQADVGMWMMPFALVLHLHSKPDDSMLLGRPESCSLSVTQPTPSLSLLYGCELTPLCSIALTAAIALVNFAVMIIFLF